MKIPKFLTFVITVMSGSIVIFSSSIDIIKEIFSPKFNAFAFLFLGLIILVSTAYLSKNWSELKR